MLLENQLVLSGVVCREPETHTSPAGISITRLVVEHKSSQVEAGMPREAYCRIVVALCGDDLVCQAAGLQVGSLVKVTGFLHREQGRGQTAKLVLHAQALEC